MTSNELLRLIYVLEECQVNSEDAIDFYETLSDIIESLKTRINHEQEKIND